GRPYNSRSFAQKQPSGFRLQAPGRLRLAHACKSAQIKADPSRKSSAQDFACRLLVGCACLTPAKRLKMQRGTFEGSLAVRSIRKRPDARHFVWHGLLHPLCHSISTENK